MVSLENNICSDSEKKNPTQITEATYYKAIPYELRHR